MLFAKTLGYEFQNTMPDFALNMERFLPIPISLPKDYAIFVHNASWTSKLWPEAYWAELVKKTTKAGLHVLLPWGNNVEKARAERLSSLAENNLATVLPRMRLSQLASVFRNAKAAVFVDTGLGHLAGALNIPAVSLYGATDPALIGTLGASQIHLQANFPCAPCKLRKCNYRKPTAQRPACFTNIPPEKVWTEFQKII
jgi:heptosyltransferase-1